MLHRLNADQRERLQIAQASPAWKAEYARRMDAGINAGTHAVCAVCGNKGKKAEPDYDICMICWYSRPRSADKARVIAQTNRKAGSK